MPESLVRSAFAACPDAAIVVSPEGLILLANPAVLELFGYRPEELIGKSLTTLIPPRHRLDHFKEAEEYFRSPRPRRLDANLELMAQHRDGYAFEVDIGLAPIEHGGTTCVVAYVRDARERHRHLDQLRWVNEITEQLLGGANVEDVLQFAASRARVLVDAAASWIVVPSSPEVLVVCAADGRGATSLLGTELDPALSMSGRVMATGKTTVTEGPSDPDTTPLPLDDLNLGPLMHLPLVSDSRRLGALVLARSSGSAMFETRHVAIADVFAAATANAIKLAEDRIEHDRLRLIEEDERIARNLHDTVIQRLFAVGMSLQAARNHADAMLGGRIDAAVDNLDDVIRDIRNTIFRP